MASGSYRGRDHALRGANRQDEVVAAARDDLAFGFVADGCGEGRHSELGARLTVEVAARVAAEASDDVEAAMQRVVREVTRALEEVVFVVGPRDPRRFVAEHLCATLVGFIARGARAAVVVAGDGALRVDDEVLTFDAGGRPGYLAYALTGAAPRVSVRAVEVRRTIAAATDGVSADALAALAPLGADLTRHLVLLERGGDLADDGAIAWASRIVAEVAS